MNDFLLYLAIGFISIISLIIILLLFFWRFIVKKIFNYITKIILTDTYQENIIELLPGVRHMGLQNLLENNLRSNNGKVLQRPLGSSKEWPHLDPIKFIAAQTKPFATPKDEEIDLSVKIGPRAKKPLNVEIPLLISGMGYGVGVSGKVRLALATAANKMGTAVNSGEGGILPEELNRAGKYILQYSSASWGKEENVLKRANMIEIKLGQGAKAAMGVKLPPKFLVGKAREVMGLKKGEDAIIYENYFENQTLNDLRNLVTELREISNGVPIGVKMGASGNIEQDIDHVLQLGIDYIALDGGQAATHSGAPILADDFGIPILHGLIRAVDHLEKINMKEHISLIASGGLLIPGHFLKALALGADAVYVGSAMLFATAHQQVSIALPFEPPTQVVWNEGRYSEQFDMKQGAKTAKNFLNASVEEMKVGLRAMGKRSLDDLSKKDLVTFDKTIAEMANISYTFEKRK